MSERRLNIFIDESGDFGPYEFYSPYYLVSVVLHDQDNDIGEDIRAFNSHLQNIGYENHAIHTGPLIRRESVYSNDLVENRKYLFNALFHFTRKLKFQYTYVKINKSHCHDSVEITLKVSKALADILYNLICTMELLAEKAESNSFTRSEKEFFGNIREFKKSYLKYIRKKIL